MLLSALFGPGFPATVGADSMCGQALSYADLTRNDGKFPASADGPAAYLDAVARGRAKPLDFVVYVPGDLEVKLPNAVATGDAAKILTASFRSGEEVWA